MSSDSNGEEDLGWDDYMDKLYESLNGKICSAEALYGEGDCDDSCFRGDGTHLLDGEQPVFRMLMDFNGEPGPANSRSGHPDSITYGGDRYILLNGNLPGMEYHSILLMSYKPLLCDMESHMVCEPGNSTDLGKRSHGTVECDAKKSLYVVDYEETLFFFTYDKRKGVSIHQDIIDSLKECGGAYTDD